MQVAPFTAPRTITIPSNIPSGGIKPGIYRRYWYLKNPNPSLLQDIYTGPMSRRENIISFYAITRGLKKMPLDFNQANASKSYMKGEFLPDYGTFLKHYDCANNLFMMEYTPVHIITAADGFEGWSMPTDRSETKFIPVPNQVRITIEGYPYWASHDKNDWTTRSSPPDKPEWEVVTPGTIEETWFGEACDSKL
jgi:hypothetical protein